MNTAKRFEIRRLLSGVKDERGIGIRARTIAIANGAAPFKEQVADVAIEKFRDTDSAEQALDAARAEANRLASMDPYSPESIGEQIDQ